MQHTDSNPRILSPSPFGLSLHTSFSATTTTTTTPFHGRAGSDCSVSPLSSTTASPTSSPTSPFRRMYRSHALSAGSSSSEPRSRSQSPFSLHSIILRRRPSLVLLRRRPSAVDMALSEERSRCDEDSVERQGLNMMEPRPVDPVSIPMDLNAHIFEGPVENCASLGPSSSKPQHPRFVMGGIFEIMEGRA
ncbi:hypothetical protein ASPZODRAFT_128258 [Penicilliopsis zonata CBS 506.65]|uniref:Uncharacterized protein n=1 Tax=Penicilliopsis zonata CBS 506.65 TaxID=1073090 RepID=A0A1L9SR91_9EURO|nr:hypothetical protein ASPZODRAFT_128258 [Penicilliopsis zonata CBS 506.65]OJJ49742.1 hypothetical protein ASPZODRAFT_128258 [Penicilliopsis zonata CBS 506.65]